MCADVHMLSRQRRHKQSTKVKQTPNHGSCHKQLTVNQVWIFVGLFLQLLCSYFWEWHFLFAVAATSTRVVALPQTTPTQVAQGVLISRFLVSILHGFGHLTSCTETQCFAPGQIRSNKYPNKSWRLLIPADEVPVCNCKEECGEGCLNRELYQVRVVHCERFLVLLLLAKGQSTLGDVRFVSQPTCLVWHKECAPGYCPTKREAVLQHRHTGHAQENTGRASAQRLTETLNRNPRRSNRSDDVAAVPVAPKATGRRKKKEKNLALYCANTRIQREAYPKIEVSVQADDG